MFSGIKNILIAIGVSLIIGFGFGHHMGIKKYDEYKLMVDTQAKIQTEKSKETERKSNVITKNIVSRFNADINGLRQYSPFKLPSISTATSSVDGSTTNQSLIMECTQTTIQLRALQDWVQQQYINAE